MFTLVSMVDQNRPVAVVPVERDETSLSRLLLRRLGSKFGLKGDVALADALDPPSENVADRRPVRLDAEEAGQASAA